MPAFLSSRLLETPRLLLRPLTHQDQDDLAPILGDPQVMYAWEHPFSPEETKGWIEENLRRYESDGISFLAAVEKSTGRLAGVIGPLYERVPGWERPALGIAYILSRDYWGKGYAREGAEACLDYLFQEWKAARVITLIHPQNRSSRNLSRRLGLAVSGQCLVPCQGREVPRIVYEISRERWLRLKAEGSPLPPGYTLCTDLREKPTLRKSFFQLAKDTFDLSFEEWYQRGWWGDHYRPYALVCGEEVAANASVNLLTLFLDGRPTPAIQIGTVMTHPRHRGKGLSRFLLEEILHQWAGTPPLLYLFANPSVLNFYPKFGFIRQEETQYSRPLISVDQPAACRPLNLDRPADLSILLQKFRQGNPFSRLSMADNPELFLFWCSSLSQENLLYFPQEDGVVIATHEGGQLLCWDILGEPNNLDVLLSGAALPGGQSALLGFPPKSPMDFLASPVEGEDFLFIWHGDTNIWQPTLRFPLLSHA